MHRDFVAFLRQEFDDLAAFRAWDLDFGLVGEHVAEGLVFFHDVPLLDLPSDDLPFGEALAEFRHLEFEDHAGSPLRKSSPAR